MFRFTYIKNKNLPKLAWLCEIKKSDKNATVYCGSRVECRDDFFVAGVWDGEFLKSGFDESEVFYGTGCKKDGNTLAFVTPSHALERLVSTETESSVIFSNSLPFLMSFSDISFDNKIDQYERFFCSILDGPQKMTANIPMAEGKCISQYIVSVITVDESCNICVENCRKQQPFADFADYESRLLKAMENVRDNAASSDREHTHYGIITTMSSGYDSPACSLIAKKIGCQTSVSLIGGHYDSDDGSTVAKEIGFENIIQRNMYDYRKTDGLIDTEFLAGGELGTMLQFSVFDDLFEDNLVFFGLRGSYWDKEASMTEGFEMIGYFNCESDASITENALKHGFIPMPIPTFGASACNSIFKISTSEEMEPWSIGGSYDKPIPRRILESAGVKRESFGMVKYGGGFSFSRDNKARLKHRMSEEGYNDFIRFVDSGKGIRKSAGRTLRTVKYIWLNRAVYLNFVFSKLHIGRRFKAKPERMANPGIVAELLFWGTDTMKKRYAGQMKED